MNQNPTDQHTKAMIEEQGHLKTKRQLLTNRQKKNALARLIVDEGTKIFPIFSGTPKICFRSTNILK